MQETWRRGFSPWVRMILWRRKWQPTLILAWKIPWTERTLAGNSPWSCKESDIDEQLNNDSKEDIGRAQVPCNVGDVRLF